MSHLVCDKTTVELERMAYRQGGGFLLSLREIYFQYSLLMFSGRPLLPCLRGMILNPH